MSDVQVNPLHATRLPDDVQCYQVALDAAFAAGVASGRSATCKELADKIAKMPFGDTAASFAVWIREQA